LANSATPPNCVSFPTWKAFTIIFSMSSYPSLYLPWLADKPMLTSQQAQLHHR
jgi:hypothetical protein